MKVIQELAGYLTIDQAGKELGFTYPKMNYLIKEHNLSISMLGHTRLIHRDELKKLAKIECSQTGVA